MLREIIHKVDATKPINSSVEFLVIEKIDLDVTPNIHICSINRINRFYEIPSASIEQETFLGTYAQLIDLMIREEAISSVTKSEVIWTKDYITQ